MLDLRDANEYAAHRHLLGQERAAQIEEEAAKWVDANPARSLDVDAAFFQATSAELESLANALRVHDLPELGRHLENMVRRVRIEERAEDMAMEEEG